MEALQYIYTSWRNGDSTEKGYMIYSRSEGISEAECGAIKDAMQYLAPKELMLTPTPQEIADIFPYAFSYFILPTGRGCVAQSTYLGKDYSGRYGNYIIYALVFDCNDLPCRPAEFFAEPYIKTAMTNEELEAPSPVPPLPPLRISEYASVINDEQLSEFLFDKEEEFAQLIALVLAARDAGVPFYLNDTRENLVLWSAAIARILPFRLAKKFTFNTYVGDHESMRSARAREEGLNFHLIGVRPDANYFNYATECKSNRHVVMDFIGGHMTPDIVPGSFAQAMASSITMDYEEIDAFGEFLDATSFEEISGNLQNAYLYYQLLKNDEFEFSAQNLWAVLTFGSSYCSDGDNADVGGKLLARYQAGEWKLEPDALFLVWRFVCRYAGFMIFSLYDLFTEEIYLQADEATGPCGELNVLLRDVKEETPQQYREYLNYFNSPDNVEHMLLYLAGHNNPFTNDFYVNWLFREYSFASGLSDGQSVSKLLTALLKNITRIKGSEQQMIDILFTTADDPKLFENVMDIFMKAFHEGEQLERLCVAYVEAADALSEERVNRFEQQLMETPAAAPIAARLCARKIAAAKKPEAEFWRFYENQRARIAADPGFSIDPMILACMEYVEDKSREDVAIEMLQRLDPSLIHDGKVIVKLTNIINACSVKSLAKMDKAFLRKVCKARAGAAETKAEKVRAVYFGEVLTADREEHGRQISLTDDLGRKKIRLKNLDKSDYETYVKNYFEGYFVLVRTKEDIGELMKIFDHDRWFSEFTEDYLSALKKMEKKRSETWRKLTAWTCIYLVCAERSDGAAEQLYKPFTRYLRSIGEGELLDIRQDVLRDVPASRCEYLFEEVRRKEGFSEKLGNIFHKK